METRIDEISDGIYRLSTFVPDIMPPTGFTSNQFLIPGDEPLLFHTGLRKMFPLLSSAVARIMSVEKLRWVMFGHYEVDECGSRNEWLAVALRHTSPRECWHAICRLTTPRIVLHGCCQMVRFSTLAASGSATSTRLTCHMAGMPG